MKAYCIETCKQWEPMEVRFPLSVNGVLSKSLATALVADTVEAIALWHDKKKAEAAMIGLCPEGANPLIYGGLCVERISKTIEYNRSAQLMLINGCYQYMD